jgi:sugar lactone lactonase YvrE
VSNGTSTGPVEKVLDTPERHLGDGLALDADGGLYVACYTPDVIYRLSPEGILDVVAEDWQSVALSSPTNLAFAGPELRTLVAASLGRWHLAKAEVRVPGVPPHHPRLPG